MLNVIQVVGLMSYQITIVLLQLQLILGMKFHMVKL